MTVTRNELAEPNWQRIEKWNPDEFWARIPWKVDWDDRYTFIDETGVGAGELYPPNPGLGARAYAASVVGYGDPQQDESDSRLMRYDSAIVNVDYSTNAPTSSGTVFVTEELLDYSLGLPENNVDLVWSDKSPVTDQEAAYKPFTGTMYRITYHRLYAIPVAMVTLKDYVNAGTWASYTLGVSFAAGTMLYTGGGAKRDMALGTIPKWKMTLCFLVHPTNWNHCWKVGSGWQAVYLRSSPTTQYIRHPSGNFNQLIP